MKHISDIIDDATGYYTKDFSFEPFDGEILNLTGSELNIIYQRYWSGTEYQLRDWLEKRDQWYQTMPYSLWKDGKCITQTVRYLKESATRSLGMEKNT